MKEEITESTVSIKGLVNQSLVWTRLIIRKWILLLVLFLAGGIGGFFYASTRPLIYTATLSFALEDDNGANSMSGALGLASQLGLDRGSSGGIFAGSNLVELMKSRLIVEKALLNKVHVNNTGKTLADLYIDYNGWRDAWKNNGKPDIRYDSASVDKGLSYIQDSLMTLICNNLRNSNFTIAPKEKNVSILNINVTAPNELFAKYFAEALVKEVSDFYIVIKNKRNIDNLAILQKQTDSVRGELNASISGVARADDNTYNLNPALNIERTTSKRRQVDIQANTAILTELIKNLEMAKVTLRKETPLIQVIDSPVLPLERKKLSKRQGAMIGGLLLFFAGVAYVIGSQLLRKEKYNHTTAKI